MGIAGSASQSMSTSARGASLRRTLTLEDVGPLGFHEWVRLLTDTPRRTQQA